jgi:RNase P subunit RPR2
MDACLACKLPLSTLVRDEQRLVSSQVVHRCPECSHIIIYRKPPREPLRDEHAQTAEPRLV